MSMLLAVLATVFLIVVLAEIFWRTKIFGPEQSRKLVHVGVGTFASTWGFILEDKQIVFIAGAMFLVVLASRVLGVFGSIHSVSRKTWGELFFPLGIASAALLADSPWIYMAAVLHVSIADGLAALIGRKYIKKHGYKVFKQQKTVVGTLVFFSVSRFTAYIYSSYDGFCYSDTCRKSRPARCR
jgi:dolichol kinase